MKFKILKGTPTFEKLQGLYQLIISINKKTKALVERLGAEQFLRNDNYLAGAPIGFQFDKCPDGWKSEGQGCYFPKANLKANKPLLAEIKALPKLDKQELLTILGYKPMQRGKGNIIYFSPSFRWGNEFCLLEVQEDIKFTPNADMIEILSSEYKTLSNQIDLEP